MWWNQLLLTHEVDCVHLFMLYAQRCQVGDLTLAMVEILMPHKSANMKTQHLCPESWLLNICEDTTNFISVLQISFWRSTVYVWLVI